MTKLRSNRRTFRFVRGLPIDAREKEHNKSVIRTHAANSTRWRRSPQNVDEVLHTQKESTAMREPRQITDAKKDEQDFSLTNYPMSLHTIAILPTDGISVLPQAETMSLLSSSKSLTEIRHGHGMANLASP